MRATSVGAIPFLWLFGIVAGGWQMARAALIAQARIDGGDADFPDQPDHHDALLRRPPDGRAAGLANTVMNGAAGALAAGSRCSDAGGTALTKPRSLIGAFSSAVSRAGKPPVRLLE